MILQNDYYVNANVNVNVIIYYRANVINESEARKTHTTKQEDDGRNEFLRLCSKESIDEQDRISRGIEFQTAGAELQRKDLEPKTVLEDE